MHLIDLSVGFKGTTAIVGNTIPIGVGLGLALQLDGGDNIAVVYLGDAAVEEGAFYESANFAALRKLPVLFVCENNLYSVYSPLSVRQPKGRKIFEMVNAMGVPSSHGDGNDVESAYNLLGKEIADIRAGKGPRFVELDTYRWREHCGPNFDNDLGYRTEKEFLDWKKRDPIALHTSKLVSEKLLSEIELKKIETEIEKEVREAFEFADRSPYPKEEDAFHHIFAGDASR